MDNRLDFVSKFKDHDAAINEMTRSRKCFIALDEALRELAQEDIVVGTNPQIQRQISIARTHIEDACQHTIKALCLKHEAKE